jgi:hypothetical protein
MFIDWYKNRNNGRYIGMVCIENKHYYASGDSLRTLLKNVKQNLWKSGISSKWVTLSPNESKDGIDLTWADPKFITKWVVSVNDSYKRTAISRKNAERFSLGKTALVDDDLQPLNIPKAKPTTNADDTFVVRDNGDMIEVFKVKKVASYKKFNGNIQIITNA